MSERCGRKKRERPGARIGAERAVAGPDGSNDKSTRGLEGGFLSTGRTVKGAMKWGGKAWKKRGDRKPTKKLVEHGKILFFAQKEGEASAFWDLL